MDIGDTSKVDSTSKGIDGTRTTATTCSLYHQRRQKRQEAGQIWSGDRTSKSRRASDRTGGGANEGSGADICTKNDSHQLWPVVAVKAKESWTIIVQPADTIKKLTINVIVGIVGTTRTDS